MTNTDRYAHVNRIAKMDANLKANEMTGLTDPAYANWTPRHWYQYARMIMSNWWDADTIEERTIVQCAWEHIPQRYRRAAKQTPRLSALPEPKRIITRQFRR